VSNLLLHFHLIEEADQVFVDHADINNNFGYANLMCKVASELGITVDSEKSQEVQYQSDATLQPKLLLISA
jgi:hypothetical protein